MTQDRAIGSQSERVDALLRQMRLLCSQIDAIGLEQQRLLDEDMLEEFVASLNSRNPKIESLAHAGKLVEDFLESDGIGAEQVRQARKQLDEMSTTIAGILERDAKQQVVVEERRRELSRQLSGVDKVKNAVRAYSGGERQPNPTLQDREG